MDRKSPAPVEESSSCSDHLEENCVDDTGQNTRLQEKADRMLFSLPQTVNPVPVFLLAAQPIFQSLIHPAIQPLIQPVNQPLIQPVKQPVNQPLIQPVNQPLIQQVKQPVIQPGIQPIILPVNQPLIQPVNQPVIQPVIQPAIQSVIQPVKPPDIQPIILPVNQSLILPVNQPVIQPVNQPAIQSVIQPVKQPDIQPIIQSVNQPLIQPVNQPLILPVNQPLIQPVKQPLNQHLNQPVAQPVIQPVILPESQQSLGKPKGEKIVIKFPFRHLKSGKIVDDAAQENQVGSSKLDHDYVSKDGSSEQNKGTSMNKRQLSDPGMDDRVGPARDWRSYDQDCFLHEYPSEDNHEKYPVCVNSQEEHDGKDNEKSDIVHQADSSVNITGTLTGTDTGDNDGQVSKKLPHICIEDGIVCSENPPSGYNNNIAIWREERSWIKRIVKLRKHDHSYSTGEDDVSLRQKVDAANGKMAEMKTKLNNQQKRNKRLSNKIKALEKDAEELRAQNRTLRFLESLQYRPALVN